MLEGRERNAGEHHESSAQQHHVAKIVPRRDQADEQGEYCSPEEGSRRHKPDLDRAEAEGRQVRRQDDDRKAIAEPAQTSRGVKQIDVRVWWRHDGSNRNEHPPMRMAAQESSPPPPAGEGTKIERISAIAPSQLFALAVLSSAARSPLASLIASSLAQ